MYLTAMLVIDRTRSNQPIVSMSEFHHGPDSSEDFAKVDEIANGSPGAHVRSVGVGQGRPVLAFIDISAPDNTSRDEIAALLDELSRKLEGVDSVVSATSPPRSARFHCIPARNAQAAADLQRLRNELLNFLGVKPTPAAVKILLSRDEDGLVLELDDASRTRLQRARPASVIPRTLRISDHVLQAMSEHSAADVGDLVESMTGMSLVELDRLGGAQIARRSDDEVVWTSRQR